MSVQLAFAGIEPRGGDNVFFALLPDAAAAGCIHGMACGIRKEFSLLGAVMPQDRLHVSLDWVGDRPSDGLMAIADAAALAVAGTVPFTVSFDRVASFRGGPTHPLVLLGGAGIDRLGAFHRTLGEALRSVAPCRYKRRPHVPHITMLRDPRRVPERKVDPVTWTVRDFVLIHSLVGRGRHLHLGRWRLSGEG